MRKEAILGFVILFFISFINGHAQNPDCHIKLNGITELNMNSTGGVLVKLLENEKVIKELVTDQSGLFEFKLDTGTYYTIEISKAGFITKRLAYDTRLPKPDKVIWKNDCAINMVKDCEGVDLSALEQPIDIIKYEPKTRSFKSDETYTKKTFRELDKIYYALENCTFDKYDEKVKKAETLLKQKNYEEAKKYFQEALTILPDESYPKEKIAEINRDMLKDNASMAAYETFKKQGDDLFAQNKLEDALVAYTKAREIKETEELISKISLINQKMQAERLARNTEQLAKQQETQSQETQLDNLVSQADMHYKNENYMEAKNLYQKALQLDPGDVYVQTRIEKLDKLITKQLNQNAADRAAENEEKYKNAVQQAGTLQAQNKPDQAILKLQEALVLKPGDAVAQQKINELQKVVASQKEAEMAKAENERKYNELVQEGKNLLALGELESSRQKLESALLIKPGDAAALVPLNQVKQKIEEQNKLLAKKDQEKKYTDHMNLANSLFAQGKLAESKSQYEQALLVKPGDSRSTIKIAEINQKLQAEEQNRLTEQQKEMRFKETLLKADQYYGNGQLELARAEYQKALTYKPGDASATQKIAEIDKRVKQAQLAQQLANEKESGYTNAMAKGDQYYAAGDFQQAKAMFQQAQSFKPDDVLAQSKIINAENAQLTRQKELQTSLKKAENEKSYNKAIQQGDQLMALGEFEQAKVKFNEAQVYKPGDAAATSKITVADNAIAEKQEKAAKAEESQKEYMAAVNKASALLSSGQLAEARLEYQKASNIKPGDQLVAMKIKEIDQKIIMQQQKDQADQQKLQRYNEYIRLGDLALTKKDYQQALAHFEQAKTLQPAEGYPLGKINEINQELNKQKAVEDSKRLYDTYIIEANNYYKKNDLQHALIEYKNALKIEPSSVIAKQQIEKIEKALELVNNNQSAGNSAAPKKALAELKFINDNERNEYLVKLSKKFPEGITHEVYTEQFKTTNRYIVIRDGMANEYRQIIHSWGGIDYYINDKATNDLYFRQQTKKRDGEYYKKFTK